MWNCIPNEFVRTYYILNCMCFGNSACSLKKVSEMRNPKMKLNAGPCINVESIWRFLRTFRLLQPTPSKEKNISQFFLSCCATEKNTQSHFVATFLVPFCAISFHALQNERIVISPTFSQKTCEIIKRMSEKVLYNLYSLIWCEC